MAGLLRTYSEFRHPNPEHAAYIVIHTIEALTHCFAAHPDDSEISRGDLQAELLGMLSGYLQGS